MLRCVFLGVIAALAWGACGGESTATDDDDDGTSSTGAGASGSGGAGPGASSASQGAGGASVGNGGSAPAPIEVCLARCDAPIDCAVPNAPAFDEDNYACDEGACRYLGCQSDAECQAQGNFVCREQFGIKTCVVSCSTPADCGTPNNPAYDADNYACDAGACIYLGCLSDGECQASIGPNYVCHDFGGQFASCTPSCNTVTDCDQGLPANDADNYVCDGGRCIYQGCNSDAECMMQGDLVCR